MIDNTIILVDDDKADQEIIKQAISKTKTNSKLITMPTIDEKKKLKKKKEKFTENLFFHLDGELIETEEPELLE